jgi:hypothetical protein
VKYNGTFKPQVNFRCVEEGGLRNELGTTALPDVVSFEINVAFLSDA